MLDSYEINNETLLIVPYDYGKSKVYEYDDLYELVFDGYEVLYVLKNGFENERMIEFFIKNLTINKKKIKNRMKK